MLSKKTTIIHLFINIAFTLILPLFPALISHYREHDDSGLFKLLEDKVDVFRVMVGAPVQFNTVLFGGFLGSLFSFLQFLASPVVGGLSDRFGRRPLMIVTTIGISITINGITFTKNDLKLATMNKVIYASKRLHTSIS